MTYGEYNGQRGWLVGDTFYPESEYEKGVYRDRVGFLHKNSGEFFDAGEEAPKESGGILDVAKSIGGAALEAGKHVVGAAEAAASIATGSVGFLGGLASIAIGTPIATAIRGGDVDWVEAEDVMNEVANAITYKPMTESGKGAVGLVSDVFNAYHGLIDKFSDTVGQTDEQSKARNRIIGDVATLALPHMFSKAKTAAQAVRLRKAQEALNKGDVDTAESYIEEAVREDPKMAEEVSAELDEKIQKSRAEYKKFQKQAKDKATSDVLDKILRAKEETPPTSEPTAEPAVEQPEVPEEKPSPADDLSSPTLFGKIVGGYLYNKFPSVNKSSALRESVVNIADRIRDLIAEAHDDGLKKAYDVIESVSKKYPLEEDPIKSMYTEYKAASEVESTLKSIVEEMKEEKARGNPPENVVKGRGRPRKKAKTIAEKLAETEKVKPVEEPKETVEEPKEVIEEPQKAAETETPMVSEETKVEEPMETKAQGEPGAETAGGEEVPKVADDAESIADTYESISKTEESEVTERRPPIEEAVGETETKSYKKRLSKKTVDKIALLSLARKMGINPKGMTLEELKARVKEASGAKSRKSKMKGVVEEPVQKIVEEPTQKIVEEPAEGSSVHSVDTATRDAVVMDYLRREHGKVANDIFKRLTEPAKDKIYKSEVSTIKEEPLSPHEELLEAGGDFEKLSSPIHFVDSLMDKLKDKLAPRNYIQDDPAFIATFGDISNGHLTTLKHAVQFIAEKSPDVTAYKHLASTLVKYFGKSLENVNFHLTDNVNLDFYGHYNPNVHAVEINLGGKTLNTLDFSRIVLHEAIHSLTFDRIRSSTAARERVRLLLDEARRHMLTEDEIKALDRASDIYFSGKEARHLYYIIEDEIDRIPRYKRSSLNAHDMYSLVNEYEFTASAMTDNEFMARLDSIKSKPTKISLFDKFVRFVKESVLGMYNGVSDSLLKQVVSTTAHIMIQQALTTNHGTRLLKRVSAYAEFPDNIVLRTAEKVKKEGISILNTPLLDGVLEVARNIKAKGFQAWSKEMVKIYGRDIEGDLKYLWSMMNWDKTVTDGFIKALKPYGSVDKLIQGQFITKDGVIVPRVAITEAELNHLRSIKVDLERPKAVPGIMSTKIHDIEYIDAKNGTKFKELLYYPARESYEAVRQIREKYVGESRRMAKALGLKYSDITDVAAYAIAKQLREVDDKVGLAILSKQTNIPKRLKPNQMRWYNFLRDVFEKAFQDFNRARILSGQEPIEYVGDYVTFARNLQGAMDRKIDIVNARKVDIAPYMRPGYFVSSAQSRVHGAPVAFDLNLDTIFSRYIDSVYGYIYRGPIIARVAEWRKLNIGTKETPYRLADVAPNIDIFLSNFSDAMVGYAPLDVMLARMVGYKGVQAIKKFRHNLATSITAASARMAVIQLSALPNTVAEIRLPFTLRGIAGALRPKTWKFARDHSQILRTRFNEDALVDTISDIAFRSTYIKGFKNRVNSIISEMQDKGIIYGVLSAPEYLTRMANLEGLYVGIKTKASKAVTLLDAFTATATWIGAYKKATFPVERGGLGMSPTGAIRYADDVVTKTQMSSLPIDVAYLQNSLIGKTIAFFQTWMIGNWNFVTRDVLGIKNPKVGRKEAMKKLIRLVIATTAINYLYENVMGMRSPNPTPVASAKRKYEENYDDIEALVELGREIASYAPIIAQSRYGYNIMGGVIDRANDVSMLLMSDATKNNRGDRAKKLAGLVGDFWGIPGLRPASIYWSRVDRGYNPLESLMGPVERKEKSDMSTKLE